MVSNTVDVSPSEEGDSPARMAPTTIHKGIGERTEQLILLNFDSTEDVLSNLSTLQYRAFRWVADQRIEDEDEAIYAYTDARVLSGFFGSVS